MSGQDASTSQWRVWSTTASVAVTDPELTPDARRLVDAVIADVDRACSRFRPDSELMTLAGRSLSGVVVSEMLAALAGAALDAARLTDGDVDPTVGCRMIELGYDRDIDEIRDVGGVAVALRRLPDRRRSWRELRLDGVVLTAPDDVILDLGATAKAFAADRAARAVAAALGCGVLVGLGGDIATAGPRREGPWQVLVQDAPGDPAQQVSLSPGWGMATSSTQHRRWRAGGRDMHHILDPRSGLPAPETWRTATVVAPSCVRANALSTAAIVRGASARGWLAGLDASARLVDAARHVHLVGAWPEASVTREGALSNVR